MAFIFEYEPNLTHSIKAAPKFINLALIKKIWTFYKKKNTNLFIKYKIKVNYI